MIWLVSVVYRFRYYFAWAVSESAMIFSGFCFNGWAEGGRSGDAPEKARWDRYVNTRIRQVRHCCRPCTMMPCCQRTNSEMQMHHWCADARWV